MKLSIGRMPSFFLNQLCTVLTLEGASEGLSTYFWNSWNSKIDSK